MSSTSPDQGGSQISPSSADVGDDPSSNLEFLKNLTEKRNVRADGSQPKKRGPKPDSKPALTRRQELNRQAQRTHRERKELYIKALEDEVMRLKEVYSNVSQDKEQLAQENKHLRGVLGQNGIPFADALSQGPLSSTNFSHRGTSYDRDLLHDPGSSSSVFTPGQASQSSAPSLSSATLSNRQPPLSGQQLQGLTQQAVQSKGLDYDQAGIDFVLTLERPCMNHLPFLLEMTSAHGGRPCGHAMMATCPPQPFETLPSDSPFNPSPMDVDEGHAPATWALSKGGLSTLLDLSAKLDLDFEGELTPVTAWALLMSHPRLEELESRDIKAVAEALQQKIRCYGFGAVTEDFEVRDAIEGVLANKPMQMSIMAM